MSQPTVIFILSTLACLKPLAFLFIFILLGESLLSSGQNIAK